MGSQFEDVDCQGDLTCNNLIVRGVIVGGDAQPRFIFQPGGETGGGVFADFLDLYDAIRPAADLGTVYLSFDTSISSPAIVPQGNWDITNIVLTNTITQAPVQPDTLVELADGAIFFVIPPVTTVRIEGYGLQIRCDRTDPENDAPFLGINLVLDGLNVRLFNTDPSALPMIVGTGANTLIITGSCVRGQIGNGQLTPPVAAPLIDAAGGTFGITAGAGLLYNGAITDSVGGAFVFVRSLDDSFNGGGGNDTTFDFPDLIAGGGVFDGTSVEHRARYLIDAALAVTTWDAFPNELVRGDTSGGPLTVHAPPATAPGNHFTVKDASNNAAAHNITITALAGDTIQSGIISNNGGSKTWVCDPDRNWLLVAVV